jgi:hypothetical protein
MRVLIYNRQEKNKIENKVPSLSFIILNIKIAGYKHANSKYEAKPLSLKLLNASMTKHYEVSPSSIGHFNKFSQSCWYIMILPDQTKNYLL